MTRSDPDSGTDGGLAIPGALPADLVRALGWLRSHLAEPIELEILADVAGVRPRTLETHFRMFLGVTPLGWVRRMRLARARQQFVRRGPRTAVTAVALNSGFTKLGRFAAEYRKAFGELPSATVNRAKRASAPFDEGADEAMRQTLDALAFAFAVERTRCNIALEKLGRPQELAAGYGLPKAVASWCWAQRAAHNFGPTPDTDRARAFRLAEEAFALAPDDALTLTLSSGTLVLRTSSRRPTGGLNRRWRSTRGWPTPGSGPAGCPPISATAKTRSANSGSPCT
jgi:AraC-like DNA-binding protein